MKPARAHGSWHSCCPTTPRSPSARCVGGHGSRRAAPRHRRRRHGQPPAGRRRSVDHRGHPDKGGALRDQPRSGRRMGGRAARFPWTRFQPRLADGRRHRPGPQLPGGAVGHGQRTTRRPRSSCPSRSNPTAGSGDGARGADSCSPARSSKPLGCPWRSCSGGPRTPSTATGGSPRPVSRRVVEEAMVHHDAIRQGGDLPTWKYYYEARNMLYYHLHIIHITGRYLRNISRLIRRAVVRQKQAEAALLGRDRAGPLRRRFRPARHPLSGERTA